MASSGRSAAERLRRFWNALRGRAPQKPPPARSSLFHLRMEANHRAAYARQQARNEQEERVQKGRET